MDTFGEFKPHAKQFSEKVTGSARTIKGTPTIERYQAHLEGKTGLGIVPLNSDSQCKFCVIDFDTYSDKARLDIISICNSNGLPFVPFLSKSGGLHLYLFMRDFVPASQVTNIVTRLITKSGLTYIQREHGDPNATLEIFPKQTIHRNTTEAQGNWINLPYFDCRSNKTGMYSDNSIASLEDAIEHCVTLSDTLTLDYLEDLLKNLPNGQVPPCLQIIEALQPTLTSNRNNYLFNLGIMLRKRYPNDFEHLLYQANANLKNPLDDSELASTIIASLTKDSATYTYRCSSSPSVDFCDKEECKTREFGIGGDQGYFSTLEYGRLFQIQATKPYYEWEIRTQGADFVLMRFDSEADLMYQERFRQLSVRFLHILPPKVKQEEWAAILAKALSDIQFKNVAPGEDDSPENIVKLFVTDFIAQRSINCKDIDQIQLKTCVSLTENEKPIFFINTFS